MRSLVCRICGGRGDMCPHCEGYGECRSACCKGPEIDAERLEGTDQHHADPSEAPRG